mgnify:CR=1 FL=1
MLLNVHEVYLDHNASTPVAPEVRKAMTEVLADHFGNPSSLHTRGRIARGLVEQARATVAGALGARPDQIVFTSGGTEGNNAVIKGVVGAAVIYEERRRIDAAMDLLEKSVETQILPDGGHISRNPGALVELLGSDFDFSALTEVDDAIRHDIVDALPNEQIAQAVQHIDELKLRMSKRMFLLFTLGHFLNDPTHKGNTHKLFGQAHMFVSVNNFVTDRYMTDLIFATVCHRPDWCQRVADAEGALAMLYFLWLDHIEERELMYRANSIMAQEYGGMTIAEYYARLCGRASDYSRGDISLLVASRIFEYARDNTLQRCARWAELMDVDPKTRVARVHDQLQEGDLGKHVELLMECGYKIGKDLGSAWTVDGFEDIAAAAAAAEGSDDDEGQVARPDEGSTSMSAT